jgi:hypothetical protein
VLVVATLLALVPWLGLLLDVTESPGPPPGTPTTESCDSALCIGSLSHLILKATLGPAAVCAAVAVALSAILLARRPGRAWPLTVIVLAVAAMILYGIFV